MHDFPKKSIIQDIINMNLVHVCGIEHRLVHSGSLRNIEWINFGLDSLGGENHKE